MSDPDVTLEGMPRRSVRIAMTRAGAERLRDALDSLGAADDRSHPLFEARIAVGFALEREADRRGHA